MIDSRFLTRVILKNYKSIAACDVSLGPLTFLVGPNGSGKSNFLDALRFVADSLRTSLDHALRDRGGISEVRRRSGGHPIHFGLRLEFVLGDDWTGYYAFRIAAKTGGGYEVQQEECEIIGSGALGERHRFRVRDGKVRATVPVVPAAVPDRLYLVAASGLPEFRPVWEAFSHMGFYNLNPEQIRGLKPPSPEPLLSRDGANIASALGQLVQRHPENKKRIEEYLAKIVSGIQGVDVKQLGPVETIEFRQLVAGSQYPWRFLAANMSDGTLRALGILVALYQSDSGSAARVPLIGIEEPEVALHPAAAGVLIDSLIDASRNTQIVVTSHSPDLLDDARLGNDAILAVVAAEGTTRIGTLDEAGRSALRDKLYTAGELLRLNQLAPDPASRSLTAKQLRLFDEGDE